MRKNIQNSSTDNIPNCTGNYNNDGTGKYKGSCIGNYSSNCTGGYKGGYTEKYSSSRGDNHNENCTQKKNGYFTVEAALVFPVALGTVLLIVYMLLFQYNRCLMEQDLGSLALWGSRVRAENSKELQELIQKRTGEIYKDKYAAWKILELNAKLEHNRFTATGKGQLVFPAPGINFWNGNNVWEAEAGYCFWRVSPVDFVRLCNKVKAVRETED